jgi:hypothetical protein
MRQAAAGILNWFPPIPAANALSFSIYFINRGEKQLVISPQPVSFYLLASVYPPAIDHLDHL